MDQVPFTPSVVAITGGTLVGVSISGSSFQGGTISGSTISAPVGSGGTWVGGTFSGNTFINPTISGGTAIGITLTGSTILGGSISGSTITVAGGALSGTTFNAPVGSGGTWVAGTFSGTTLIAPIISGGTAKTLTLTGTTLFSGPVVVSGNTITVPSGIIFANETLANYDEGTWTPVLDAFGTPGTNTYTTQVGTYTRIGRSVTVNCNLRVNALDGALAGALFISGLPFTVGSISSAASVSQLINVTFGDGPAFLAADATSRIYLTRWVNGGSNADILASDLGASPRFYFTVTYEI